MTDQHVQLWINGHDVTCDTLAALTIKGGRSDWMAQPDPASCTFTVEWSTTGLPVPRIGDRVNIGGWLPGRPKADTFKALFTGYVTDLSDEGGWVSVVAVDPMRRLQGVFVGDTPWPVQNIPQRLDAIWAAAKTSMGATSPDDPAWMGRDSILNPATIWPPDHALRFVPPRDVDHRPALDLWYQYASPVGVCSYYQPHAADLGVKSHPPDPAQWLPARALVGSLVPAYQGTSGVVDDCLIVGDPPPRRWQNLGVVVTEWKITGPKVKPYDGTLTDPDKPEQWESVVRAPDTKRVRYGYRQGSQRTDYSDRDFHNQNPQRPWTPAEYDALGRLWLDRTSTPTWSVDGVVVVFTDATLDGVAATVVDDAWRVVGAGPSQCGVPIMLKGLGSTQGDQWVVENTGIEWVPDGWEVTIGCTDPAVYAGTVASQTTVQVVNPPASAWLDGTTLTVKVYDPTDGTPVTSGTLKFGLVGPVTPITGDTTALPTGALPLMIPAQTQSFPVTFTPAPGSPLQASTTTLRLFVQNVPAPTRDPRTMTFIANLGPTYPGTPLGMTLDVQVTGTDVNMTTGQVTSNVPVLAGTLQATVAGVPGPSVPITGATTKVPTGPLRPSSGQDVGVTVVFTPADATRLASSATRRITITDQPAVRVVNPPSTIPINGTVLVVEVVDALGQPITAGWLQPAHSNPPARIPITGPRTLLPTGPIYQGLRQEGVQYFTAATGAVRAAEVFWPITIGPAVATWADYDPEFQWDTHPGSTTWSDLNAI